MNIAMPILPLSKPGLSVKLPLRSSTSAIRRRRRATALVTSEFNTNPGMLDCFRFETKLTFVFSFILYINFGNKLETETEIFSKKFKRIQRKLKKVQKISKSDGRNTLYRIFEFFLMHQGFMNRFVSLRSKSTSKNSFLYNY